MNVFPANLPANPARRCNRKKNPCKRGFKCRSDRNQCELKAKKCCIPIIKNSDGKGDSNDEDDDSDDDDSDSDDSDSDLYSSSDSSDSDSSDDD